MLKYVAWAMQRLMTYGFQVEQTFELHAERMMQVDCPCPYHGTGDCTCQMVVLLMHSPKVFSLLDKRFGLISPGGNATCVLLYVPRP